MADIHNWPLQHFRQNYGLASDTTQVVCVNFIREWRDLEFNVASERQVPKTLFDVRFILLSEFLPEIYWKEIVEGIFFWCLTWDTNLRFTSDKSTYYILDYGDDKSNNTL